MRAKFCLKPHGDFKKFLNVQMTDLSQLPAMGQAVEAWDHDAWRPAVVKRVKTKTKEVQLAVSNKVIYLPCASLRIPVNWDGESWQVKGELLRSRDLNTQTWMTQCRCDSGKAQMADCPSCADFNCNLENCLPL